MNMLSSLGNAVMGLPGVAYDVGSSIFGGAASGIGDFLSPDDNQKIPEVSADWYQYGSSPEEAARLRNGMLAEATMRSGAFNPFMTQANTIAQGSMGVGNAANQMMQSYGGNYETAGQTARDNAANLQQQALVAGNNQFNGQITTQRMDELSRLSQGVGSNPVASGAMGGLLSLGANQYRPTLGDATNQIRQAGNQGVGQMTTGSVNQLNQFAQGPQGPSAAEAMLQQQTGRNNAAAMGLAASARGREASGGAMKQAQFQQAANNQQATMDAAQIRAQEAATARGQNLQALQAAGQLGSQAEQDAAARGLQGQVAAGSLEMQLQDALARGDQTRVQALSAAMQGGLSQDQLRLAALGQAGQQSAQGGAFGLDVFGANQGNTFQGIGAQQNAMGYGTQADMASIAGIMNAIQGGAGMALQGNEQGLGANAQQMQGMQANLAGRNELLSQFYGTYDAEQAAKAQAYQNWLNNYTQIQLGNQQADVAGDSSIGGLVGAAASVIPFF